MCVCLNLSKSGNKLLNVPLKTFYGKLIQSSYERSHFGKLLLRYICPAVKPAKKTLDNFLMKKGQLIETPDYQKRLFKITNENFFQLFDIDFHFEPVSAH